MKYHFIPNIQSIQNLGHYKTFEKNEMLLFIKLSKSHSRCILMIWKSSISYFFTYLFKQFI